MLAPLLVVAWRRDSICSGVRAARPVPGAPGVCVCVCVCVCVWGGGGRGSAQSRHLTPGRRATGSDLDAPGGRRVAPSLAQERKKVNLSGHNLNAPS
jgi:hypothetical protein